MKEEQKVTKRITFDEFDKIESGLKKMRQQKTVWYPGKEYHDKLRNNFPKYYIYLLFLTEHTVPETDEDKLRVRELKKIVMDNLELVDEENLGEFNTEVFDDDGVEEEFLPVNPLQ